MKKIISMLLVITLCFSALPLSAFAQNSVNEYTNDEKEFILTKYTNNEHMESLQPRKTEEPRQAS